MGKNHFENPFLKKFFSGVMSSNFIAFNLSETYQRRKREERRSDSITGGLVFAGTCCLSPAMSACTAFFFSLFYFQMQSDGKTSAEDENDSR